MLESTFRALVNLLELRSFRLFDPLFSRRRDDGCDVLNDDESLIELDSDPGASELTICMPPKNMEPPEDLFDLCPFPRRDLVDFIRRNDPPESLGNGGEGRV